MFFNWRALTALLELKNLPNPEELALTFAVNEEGE